MRYVTALVTWISHEDGGRKTIPPLGTQYYCTTMFDKNFEASAWSVWFICTQLSAESSMIVNLGFCFDHAPHEKLTKGLHFYLYEGNRKVAIVDILETTYHGEVPLSYSDKHHP